MKDALSVFDKKSLSYTYENNEWSFTNYFEGNIRVTELAQRGTLREEVTVVEVAEDVYFLTWEDAEMGPITQLIDIGNKRIFAAVPWEGKIEIWPGVITNFVDGKL